MQIKLTGHLLAGSNEEPRTLPLRAHTTMGSHNSRTMRVFKAGIYCMAIDTHLSITLLWLLQFRRAWYADVRALVRLRDGAGRGVRPR